jgi:hypothetical protein
MNARFEPIPARHRVVIVALALVASISTILLAVLGPLALHGGLA